jgi:hypothetical protein
MDPKRPVLAEHPGNKQGSSNRNSAGGDQFTNPGGYQDMPPIGFSGRSPMMYGGGKLDSQTCLIMVVNFIVQVYHIENTSPCAGFKLMTSVVVSTDCTGRCKTNYHTITTTRIVWRYQRGNKNLQVKEGQTMQWPNKKEQKDKQRSTKYYTEI